MLVVNYETKYSQNITAKEVDSNKNPFIVPIGPFSDFGDSYVNFKQLQRLLNSYITQRDMAALHDCNSYKNQNGDKLGKNYLYCNTDQRMVSELLSSIEEESLRAQLWTSTQHSFPVTNKSTLGGLIQSRQALAKCLGYQR
jgi:hypothetical protein